MKKLFLLFVVLSIMWVIPVAASQCDTCHDTGEKHQHFVPASSSDQWSDVMAHFAAKIGAVDGTVTLVKAYPKYVDKPCFNTTAWHDPVVSDYTTNTNLPESDMIKVSPGSMQPEGVATTGFLTHGPVKDRLC